MGKIGEPPRHFFKYMTAKTGAIVLETGKVRYSAPPTLNDPFDAQLDLELGFAPGEVEAAMVKKYLDVINSPNALPNPRNDWFVALVENMRANRSRLPADDEVVAEIMPALKEGAATIGRNTKLIHDGVRQMWLNDAKIFCVSEVGDETLMWSHYANDHKGIVIKIIRDEKLDNVICAAKSIKYRDELPSITTLDEFVEMNFGGRRLEAQDYWDKIFYTKHSRWSYEREWRVVVPGEAPGQPYSLFKLQPAEVAAVILGARISDEDRDIITNLMQANYPKADLLEAKLDPKSFGISIA